MQPFEEIRRDVMEDYNVQLRMKRQVEAEVSEQLRVEAILVEQRLQKTMAQFLEPHLQKINESINGLKSDLNQVPTADKLSELVKEGLDTLNLAKVVSEAVGTAIQEHLEKRLSEPKAEPLKVDGGSQIDWYRKQFNLRDEGSVGLSEHDKTLAERSIEKAAPPPGWPDAPTEDGLMRRVLPDIQITELQSPKEPLLSRRPHLVANIDEEDLEILDSRVRVNPEYIVVRKAEEKDDLEAFDDYCDEQARTNTNDDEKERAVEDALDEIFG